MSEAKIAIEEFLDATDTALEEYDQGYADADATLGIVRSHIDDLRTVVDE